MAEDTQEQTQRSSRRMQLIIVAAVVLASLVAALAVFVFVLRPRLLGPQEQETRPLSPDFIAFQDLQLSGLPDSSDELPPILQTSITLACDSEDTAQIVENYRPRFEGLLIDLYSSKTRTQLSEPFEKDLIRQEARRRANELLKQCAPGHEGAITDVMHTRYILVEQ